MTKKLSTISIGLTLGLFLAVVHTLRTIVVWLFPNFVVNVIKKLSYSAIPIQLPIVALDAFIIGLVILFICGFVAGIVFAVVYNWVMK